MLWSLDTCQNKGTADQYMYLCHYVGLFRCDLRIAPSRLIQVFEATFPFFRDINFDPMNSNEEQERNNPG